MNNPKEKSQIEAGLQKIAPSQPPAVFHATHGFAFEYQAEKNVAKWGKQDLETLGLAIAEETGELCQAILKAKSEGGDRERIREEAIDLGALCHQIIFYLDNPPCAACDSGDYQLGHSGHCPMNPENFRSALPPAMESSDHIQNSIAEIRITPGTVSETDQLLSMAAEAQLTGKMPDLACLAPSPAVKTANGGDLQFRREWVGTPAFQAGYEAGMHHESFSTGTPPENLQSLCPFVNGPAIDRWEAGFMAAIS